MNNIVNKMDKNVSSFPNPPKFYKQKLDPPRPPAEGEFSMFGKTYTVTHK